MMTGTPAVSVIVPTYNRVAMLDAALQSLQAQTFSSFETIVVDDGSTDGSASHVVKQYPAVRLFKTMHSGAAHARNVGLRHAKGQWIAFLDSDDVWLPDSLQNRMEFLVKNPEAGLVYADAQVWKESQDADGRLISDRRKPHTGSVTHDLFLENFICTSTAIAKRELLLQAGGFRERYQPAEDYDLWLRLSQLTDFQYLNIPTANYRVHSTSVSADCIEMFRSEIRVLTDIYSLMGNEWQLESAFRQRMSRLHFFLGLLQFPTDSQRARHHFKDALWIWPYNDKVVLHYMASFWPSLLERRLRRFLEDLDLY